MNDASYGAVIPYLELYYNEEYTIIALVFLSPFVGYNAAALLNTSLHMRFGQRGVAFAGPACHVISYIIVCLAPPYPVLVLAFILSGLGNGFLDAGWNAWIGAMPNANELLGFLHGFYGLGATVAPLIATAMITKAGLPWNTWYYCMVGFAATELVTCVAAFWPRNGAVYRDQHPRPPAEHGSRLKEATLRPPAARVTWLASVFLLGYVGAEVALGGWIVAFVSGRPPSRRRHPSLTDATDDPSARRRPLRQRHDGHGLLARHHRRPAGPGLRDAQARREAGHRRASRPSPATPALTPRSRSTSPSPPACTSSSGSCLPYAPRIPRGSPR